MQLKFAVQRVQNKSYTSATIQQLLPDIYCEKCEYKFYDYYVLVLFIFYLSSELVLQGMLKNNPIKKQIDVKIQVTLKHGSWKTCRGENPVETIAKDNKDKLQILISCIKMCFP